MTLGIYVHIPFCVQKCDYCDFVSYPLGKSSSTKAYDTDVYVESLLLEAAYYLGNLNMVGHKIETVYFGGGTPTCLTGGQLFMLLKTMRGFYELSSDAEITIEVNPGTVDENKLDKLLIAGFNRLSIGVQSFKEEDLRFLGRAHEANEINKAYYAARKAGYKNIGLDLMYGIPGQTEQAWRDNLKDALELSPEHLSLYQLAFETGTPLYERMNRGEILKPDQDLSAEMYAEAIRILTQNGYRHYEISNFARPGYESRHNMRYWQNREYLGLGVSAGGFLDNCRYVNERDLKKYLERIQEGSKPVCEEEKIDLTTAVSEHMFLGLRLLEGVEKALFYKKFGSEIEKYFGPAIAHLKEIGLVEETSSHFRLTDRGVFLANNVFIEFLP